MIETRTTWEDSGYDCDHCGGVISKRTDYETGQPEQVCFQCKQCGCQWKPNGDVLRVGNGPDCQSAQRERAGTDPGEFFLSRRVLIIAGIILIAVIIRFGGFSVLFSLSRLLLPIALVAIVVLFVVRFGREQEWW